MKEEKKKKEKIKYIDDGRTIADMSNVGRNSHSKFSQGKKKERYIPPNLTGRGTLKDQWHTYVHAVKMMFLPMLVVIGIMTVAFLLLYVFFGLL